MGITRRYSVHLNRIWELMRKIAHNQNFWYEYCIHLVAWKVTYDNCQRHLETIFNNSYLLYSKRCKKAIRNFFANAILLSFIEFQINSKTLEKSPTPNNVYIEHIIKNYTGRGTGTVPLYCSKGGTVSVPHPVWPKWHIENHAFALFPSKDILHCLQ